MKSTNYKGLVDALNLLPHPEGGYFREIYRSSHVVGQEALPAGYPGNRSASTSIYFLLPGDSFSAFHRLRADEIWHFYMGDPITLHLIHPDSRYDQIIVGSDVLSGQSCQVVIPAGTWFAARVEKTSGYGLIGCTVAPGFDFADFELAKRSELVARFPQHKNLITSFTR